MIQRIGVSLACLGFSVVASASGLAGKYKMELSNDLSGISGTFYFLLSGNKEIKLLNDYDGYSIENFDVAPFFDSLDAEVEWGSDEEHHYYSFTLSPTKGTPELTKYCALFVDGPNEIRDEDGLSMELSKWNVKTKSYDLVPVMQTNESLLNCKKELANR